MAIVHVILSHPNSVWIVSKKSTNNTVLLMATNDSNLKVSVGAGRQMLLYQLCIMGIDFTFPSNSVSAAWKREVMLQRKPCCANTVSIFPHTNVPDKKPEHCQCCHRKRPLALVMYYCKVHMYYICKSCHYKHGICPHDPASGETLDSQKRFEELK